MTIDEPASPMPKRALDRETLARLRGNSGITLQWIGWNERGFVEVREDERGAVLLRGSQIGADGGHLQVAGTVVDAGRDYFLLDGTITISDAPDEGRSCRATRPDWRFAITQGRRYYRLRTFEWCDGLTDYVDIYF